VTISCWLDCVIRIEPSQMAFMRRDQVALRIVFERDQAARIECFDRRARALAEIATIPEQPDF
jgi:hypothetical protein